MRVPDAQPHRVKKFTTHALHTRARVLWVSTGGSGDTGPTWHGSFFEQPLWRHHSAGDAGTERSAHGAQRGPCAQVTVLGDQRQACDVLPHVGRELRQPTRL